MIPVVRAAILIAVMGLALPARGQDIPPFSIQVANELTYALSDRGHTLVDVFPTRIDRSVRLRCDGYTVQRAVLDIAVTVILEAGDPGEPLCHRFAEVDVGRLDPGHYAIHATVLMNGAPVAILNDTADVVAHARQCNAFPREDEISATPVHRTAEAFVAAFDSDPAYRAAFGDIGQARVSANPPDRVVLRFPPLSDPVVEADTVERTGELAQPGIPHLLCALYPSLSPRVVVVEFHDTVRDRYFMTADPGEQAAIDAGRAGAGWVRTGRTFRAFQDSSPCGPLATVFRFTNSPLQHVDLHFFTADVKECAIVRDTDWVWMFEGIAFAALNIAPEGCPSITLPETLQPAQTLPLHRAYNAGKGGVPNHRFAIDHGVIDAMVAQGWIDEGPVMCVLPP